MIKFLEFNLIIEDVNAGKIIYKSSELFNIIFNTKTLVVIFEFVKDNRQEKIYIDFIDRNLNKENFIKFREILLNKLTNEKSEVINIENIINNL